MSAAWEPGDVALVDSWRGKSQIAFRTQRGAVTAWCVLDGTDTRGLSDIEVGDSARPVVVIDPDDAKAANDLAHDVARRLGCRPGEDISHIKDAIKGALGVLTPSLKPDEPAGLGAVVEDAEGERYIRCQLGDVAPWRAESPPFEARPWRYYRDLTIVRVLSPGVRPS